MTCTAYLLGGALPTFTVSGEELQRYLGFEETAVVYDDDSVLDTGGRRRTRLLVTPFRSAGLPTAMTENERSRTSVSLARRFRAG